MSKPIIKLTPEVPVDMTLAYTEGKVVGRGQMMFSTIDGRVLYVPEPAGREIQRKLYALGIRAGDRVLIRQTAEYSSQGRQVSWDVYRAKIGVGVQSDGTFVVAAQPGAKEAAAASPQATATGPSTTTAISPDPTSESPLGHSGMAAGLRDITNMLLDVLAASQAYARQKHRGITPEDVRACVLAAYAGKGK